MTQLLQPISTSTQELKLYIVVFNSGSSGTLDEFEMYRPGKEMEPVPVPPPLMPPFRDNTVESDAQPLTISNNWPRLVASPINDDVYNRIYDIASVRDGWRGPGSQALNTNSLRAFLEFRDLVDSSHLKEPDLSLSSNGNLHAEWHKNWRRHLDIDFEPDGLALFGLIDGSSVHDGVEEIAELARFVSGRDSHPLSWNSG